LKNQQISGETRETLRFDYVRNISLVLAFQSKGDYYLADKLLLKYFCKNNQLKMNQTLDKLKRLERLIQEYPAVDNVLVPTINKILQREINKLNLQIDNLSDQIKHWEDIYKMDSQSFLNKFETGQMGDQIDFIEWASTLGMKAKSEQYISTLQGLDE